MRRSSLVALLFALLLSAFVVGPANAAPPLTWLMHDLIPEIYSVAYGNDRYVGVGAGGTLLISHDGRSWAVVIPSGTYYGKEIVFREGFFIAGSSTGVLRSADGLKWERVASLEVDQIGWAGEAYWAIGDHRLWRSTDLQAWQRVLPTRVDLVATSVKQWVAIDSYGEVYYRSTDGVAWSEVTRPAHWRAVKELASGNGQFLATIEDKDGRRQVVRSTDGLSWAPLAIDFNWKDESLTFANGRFWILGDGLSGGKRWLQAFSSLDGTTWEGAPLPYPEPGVQKLIGSGGQLFALGPQTLLQSEDGRTWKAAGEHLKGDLLAITWGAGRWVAVGENGHVQSSPDGIVWTTHDLGIQQTLAGVVWAGDRFIAFGQSSGYSCGTDPECGVAVAVSTDGLNWKVSHAPTERVLALAGGDGRYVMVTLADGLLTSTDGLTWQKQAARAPFLRDLIYWHGEFLGIHPDQNGHQLFRSKDGVSWRTQPLPTDQGHEWGLTTINGALVAYGEAPFLLRSTDGNWWEEVPLKNAQAIYKMAGDKSQKVAFLNYGPTYGDPLIGYSMDGIKWEATLVPVDRALPSARFRQIAWHDGLAIAVGMGHSVAHLDTKAKRSCVQLFSDLPSEHPACGAATTLYARNAIRGYPDGTYQPQRKVNRAEVAQMLVQSLGWSKTGPFDPLPYTDIKDSWTSLALYMAADRGVFSGFPDGTFRPDAGVTRAELVKIVAAAAGLKAGGEPGYLDLTANDWYAGWVAAARAANLIGSKASNPLWTEGSFDGEKEATRAEVTMLLANLLDQ